MQIASREEADSKGSYKSRDMLFESYKTYSITHKVEPDHLGNYGDNGYLDALCSSSQDDVWAAVALAQKQLEATT